MRKRVGKSIKQSIYNNTLQKVEMKVETRLKLTTLYKEDIEALSKLLKMNFKDWYLENSLYAPSI